MKKILLTLGSLSVVGAPIVITVACGSSSKGEAPSPPKEEITSLINQIVNNKVKPLVKSSSLDKEAKDITKDDFILPKYDNLTFKINNVSTNNTSNSTSVKINIEVSSDITGVESKTYVVVAEGFKYSPIINLSDIEVLDIINDTKNQSDSTFDKAAKELITKLNEGKGISTIKVKLLNNSNTLIEAAIDASNIKIFKVGTEGSTASWSIGDTTKVRLLLTGDDLKNFLKVYNLEVRDNKLFVINDKNGQTLDTEKAKNALKMMLSGVTPLIKSSKILKAKDGYITDTPTKIISNSSPKGKTIISNNWNYKTN